MDIKELVKWVAIRIKGNGRVLVNSFVNNNESVQIELCKLIARSILSYPNLALIIRKGDTVPLGVETETHIVILLKEALKEANND